MSSASAAAPWPAPQGAEPADAWRFARFVQLPGRDTPALQWVLRRNCSITPRQLMAVYASLCAVSLVVGLGFWWHGATYVLAFAGIELLLVGVALLVYARHAADRDTVTLAERELAVERHFGRQTQRVAFRAEWVCVEPAQAQGSLVELAGQGQRMLIGRFLRPEHRAALAHELRHALRRAQAGLPQQAPQKSELEPKR